MFTSRQETGNFAQSHTIDRQDREETWFLRSISPGLAVRDRRENRVVCGDFNVIPRNHIPREAVFQEWEYDFLSALESLGLHDTFTLRDAQRQDHSWFGRSGERYRFDYCYASDPISERVVDASFDHSPRLMRLSDHSALRIKFALAPP